MTGDARALLSAIVADPADDTVRLAYADCIEERGDAARAAFIRLQIEAERLHPDSNARLALEQRAEALFAEHWIEWWGEVCAEVGLYIPRRKSSSMVGRLSRWLVNLGMEGDNPYDRDGNWVRWDRFAPVGENGHVARTEFRRGFAESVEVSFLPSPIVRAWPGIAPLRHLLLVRKVGTRWDDGAYLAGLHTLTVVGHDTTLLLHALQSPELAKLEELRLLASGMPREPSPTGEELARLLAVPRAKQLRRFAVSVMASGAAEAVAEAPGLAELDALGVQLGQLSETHSDPADRIAVLAQSPYLSGILELEVSGSLDPRGYHGLTNGSAWRGLRKLTIADNLPPAPLAALLSGTNLPALEELRINAVRLNHVVINLFIRSPLLKQLRHLAFAAYGVDGVSEADLRRLPEMFDLDRIETVRFDPDHDMPGLDELKRQLGDRLRMP